MTWEASSGNSPCVCSSHGLSSICAYVKESSLRERYVRITNNYRKIGVNVNL